MFILDADEWRERKVRDWLLGIVRFAVTLDAADRHTALAMAQEIDGLGSLPGRTRFQFFSRTSTAVCDAISDRADPSRNLVLRQLIGSIADHRLRAVMLAAVALDGAQPSARQDAKRVFA